MKISSTYIKGLKIIERKNILDFRGSFSRIVCKDLFKKYDIKSEFVQTNLSYNLKKNTLRGMHFQKKPYEEGKLVTCIKGKIIDFVVDIRPNSETFKKTFSMELSEESGTSLFLPKGMAHGFRTLVDDTYVLYNMTQKYVESHNYGFCFFESGLNINLEMNDYICSDKDKNLPSFNDIICYL